MIGVTVICGAGCDDGCECTVMMGVMGVMQAVMMTRNSRLTSSQYHVKCAMLRRQAFTLVPSRVKAARSVCLSLCLSVCLSVCPSLCLSGWLAGC